MTKEVTPQEAEVEPRRVMGNYVTKPAVIIQAVQWDGTSAKALAIAGELKSDATYFENTNDLQVVVNGRARVKVLATDWIAFDGLYSVLSNTRFTQIFGPVIVEDPPSDPIPDPQEDPDNPDCGYTVGTEHDRSEEQSKSGSSSTKKHRK